MKFKIDSWKCKIHSGKCIWKGRYQLAADFVQGVRDELMWHSKCHEISRVSSAILSDVIWPSRIPQNSWKPEERRKGVSYLIVSTVADGLALVGARTFICRQSDHQIEVLYIYRPACSDGKFTDTTSLLLLLLRNHLCFYYCSTIISVFIILHNHLLAYL